LTFFTHSLSFFYRRLGIRTTSTLFPYTTLFRSTDNGSEFVVRIPAADAVLSPAESTEAPSPPSGEPLDVVVIEDHEDIREMVTLDRKSTRLNSSHVKISYAVFCLKKKKHLIISI